MTAIPQRRKKRSLVALGMAVVLLATAVVLVGVAVGTLRNSQAGEAVGIDERPVAYLPSTPNALLAVEGDEGELTSIVVVTLLPSGRGGTIVTVPVNADLNSGVGERAVPLGAAYEQLEFDDFVDRVESMLSIALEHAESVDAERLRELVDPVVPIDVVLPEDVVDSSAIGTGIVAVEGEQELRGLLVVDVLTASDTTGPSHDHHDIDVAVWSGLAAGAPVPVSTEMGSDEAGAPLPPVDVDELMARLWEGNVQVRDLQLIPFDEPVDQNVEGDDGEIAEESDAEEAEEGTDGDGGEEASDGGEAGTDGGEEGTDGGEDTSDDVPGEAAPGGLDVVRIDHRDTLLVFAQISPAVVSTPNPGLTLRLEIGFTEEQLEDGDVEDVSELTRDLIGVLLFFGANVVSVDLTENPDGAVEVTEVSVADVWFLEDAIEFAPILFGESDVEVATELIDGVDVVVVLGTDYLHREDSPLDTVEADE